MVGGRILPVPPPYCRVLYILKSTAYPAAAAVAYADTNLETAAGRSQESMFCPVCLTPILFLLFSLFLFIFWPSFQANPVIVTSSPGHDSKWVNKLYINRYLFRECNSCQRTINFAVEALVVNC